MRRTVIALALLLAGCSHSSKHDYPSKVEGNYLIACGGSGGDATTCRCTLDWMERHLTLDQFLAGEDIYRATGKIPARFGGAFKDCG